MRKGITVTVELIARKGAIESLERSFTEGTKWPKYNSTKGIIKKLELSFMASDVWRIHWYQQEGE